MKKDNIKKRNIYVMSCYYNVLSISFSPPMSLSLSVALSNSLLSLSLFFYSPLLSFTFLDFFASPTRCYFRRIYFENNCRYCVSEKPFPFLYRLFGLTIFIIVKGIFALYTGMFALWLNGLDLHIITFLEIGKMHFSL